MNHSHLECNENTIRMMVTTELDQTRPNPTKQNTNKIYYLAFDAITKIVYFTLKSIISAFVTVPSGIKRITFVQNTVNNQPIFVKPSFVHLQIAHHFLLFFFHFVRLNNLVWLRCHVHQLIFLSTSRSFYIEPHKLFQFNEI